MTPCEKLGYKVGDRFRAVGAYCFDEGSIVELFQDDGTDAPLWKLVEGNCKHNNANGPGAYDDIEKFVKIHETKAQLRPGDYVSTEGMTEDQYHAVSKAFIEAGAEDVYGHSNRSIDTLGGKYLEWFSGCICMTNEPEYGGRHLTIEQVLGESPKEEGGWIKNTSGEQPVEDGTMVVLKMRDGSLWRDGIPRPAEVIGWWFSGDSSDVVEYKVVKEDETQKVQDVRLEDGPPIKRQSILDFMNSTAQFIELEGEETDTIQSLLKKADKHARKAQKHEAKRQEAIEQARSLLPEGWELTEAGAEKVDLNDPANWREGDVLEVVDADCNDGVKNGDLVVHNDSPGNKVPYCKKPDGGIRAFVSRRQLRLHHRP